MTCFFKKKKCNDNEWTFHKTFSDAEMKLGFFSPLQDAEMIANEMEGLYLKKAPEYFEIPRPAGDFLDDVYVWLMFGLNNSIFQLPKPTPRRKRESAANLEAMTPLCTPPTGPSESPSDEARAKGLSSVGWCG